MTKFPWIGHAQKLTDYDIPRIGHKIGVGEDVIHMVLDVESRGTGFDDYGVIKLFEEHVMWRNLPKAKREEARRLGVAWPKWRRNYKNNHATFLKAYEFDKTAALKACSWGLGQTLGENHIACGYDTPLQMVRAYAESEANQLEGMIEFVVANGLDDELQGMEGTTNPDKLEAYARSFARGYNGKYYYKHGYHTRLVKRLNWWRKVPDTPWSPEMAKEEEVRAPVLPHVDLPVAEVADKVEKEVGKAVEEARAHEQQSRNIVGLAGGGAGAGLIFAYVYFKDWVLGLFGG